MTAYDGYTNRSGGSLMAFVYGAIVGASAALLFAPMRGEDMRASLGDKARQSRERLRHYGESGRDWATERLQQASEVSRSALHRATDAVDTAVDRAQSAVSQGAARAHEVTEKARSVADRRAEAARSTAKATSEPATESAQRPREQWS
jgi:gas vesicle protein